MQCRACGCILAAILAVLLVTTCAGRQLQEQDSWKVLLPKGSQPEGISAGADNDIWVACLSGSIIHVDLAKNSSTVVYKERNVHLSGVKFCKKQQLLFVAGTLSGKAYLYHMQRTAGAAGPTYSVSKREVLDLNLPGKSYINDVALSQDKAYFTDSFSPVLYQVPRYFGADPSNQQRFSLNIIGSHNKDAPRPITRVKTGEFFDTKPGQFRANGIALYKTTEDSDILLVANTHTGHLYKVVVYKTEQAQPVAEAPAPPAAASGAQQAVANMAQQATMAVASRLRLGRVTDTSGSSSSSSTDSNDSSSSSSRSGGIEDSSADGVPAGLMAAAKAAAATAEEEGMEVDQALAQLDESPTLPTPQVAKDASRRAKPDQPQPQPQPQPQAKAKDSKDTKAAKQAKAAGTAAAKNGSKGQHKVQSKPMAAAAEAAAATAAVAPKAGAGKQQGKAQGAKASKQDAKWDKLARDVADLNANKQLMAAQQKQGRKVAPAEAAAGQPAEAQQTSPVPATQAVQVTGISLEDAAAAAVQAVQVGSYLTKLAGNMRSRMRMSRKQQQQLDAQLQDMPDSASSAAVSAASSVPSAARQRGQFTARPSAEAFVKAGKGTKRNEGGKKQQHTAVAAAAAAEPVLLADPVPITEPKLDINAAVLAEAATQAAYAVVAAHHQRALGRVLLTAADADSARFNWPSQMARGIVEKLGFSGRHKQVTADVEELQLPSIPGQYTKRLLVDGIAVKNDTAYVADNYNDRVWGLQLGKGLSEVKVSCVIQGPIMHVPTTLTFVGGRLWWVNAHLDTCFPFLPCPTHKFELYGINPSMCQPWTG